MEIRHTDDSDEDKIVKRKWTSERHVSVSLIIAVALNFGGGIWWSASFSATTNNRLDTVESRQKTVEALPERMAKIEVLQQATNDILKDIRSDLRLQLKKDDQRR